ncbi:MFS transporter [Salaquimonas pukyongi]|uniref:MFS transporter n=1 Tax=Salaquimonas pukyongi TaxID=2712698 RepID=UPI0012EB08A0|nr:MFS transporter [Salaquimonas pukyongi]
MTPLQRILAGFSPVAIGLGITMTVSYGAMFYSFAILAPAIMSDFGWSRSVVFGSFSIALLASAVFAPVSGRVLDRLGGRLVLSAGTVLASLALAAMFFVETPIAYLAALIAIEAMATFVQYEAGFTAMTQIRQGKARAAISAITLIAGFSSTIFWPLCSFLLEHFTWQQVYLWLAAINLAVCLPIHLSLPRHEASRNPAAAAHEQPLPEPLAGRDRTIALMALALSFSAAGFVVVAVQAHLPRLLLETGYTVAAAAAVGAMIGPFQVGARVVEVLFGQSRHPLWTALVCNIALLAGAALMFAFAFGVPAAIAFAVFFGAGQGLAHIIRGAVPLYLFGAQGYGRLTGNLGFFRILVTASAPFAIAWVSDVGGNRWGIAAIVLAGLVAVLPLLPLMRHAGPVAHKATAR